MPSEHSQLRAILSEWAQAVLLAANVVWTSLCLGGFLPGTMVMTSWLTAATLGAHALGMWLNPRRVHPAGYWFVPFLVYAAANVLWITPVHWLGWIDWFNWAQLVAVFWIVLNGIRSPRTQATLFGVLLALAAVAVWLACYQRLVEPSWLMLGRHQAAQYVGRSSGPFGIPNSLAALLLLLIPAVGALAARRAASISARIFFGWLLVVLLVGLGFSVSRGAWIALAVALSAWPLIGLRAHWRKRIGAATGVAVGVVAAGCVAYSLSAVVHERFGQLVRDAGERSRPVLWRAAWHMFQERPLVGVGGGSFNVQFEPYRPAGFLPQPIWAHNDYLNTLSDYGAVGFALFFGAAIVVVQTCISRRARAGTPSPRVSPTFQRRDFLDDPLVRQGLGIGILAFALQLFVDFHLKLPALAMALACVAGLLVSRIWTQVPSIGRGRSWRIAPMVFCLAGIAVGIGITPLYRGEALRFQAREAMDRMANVTLDDAVVRARLVVIRRQLDRAVEIAPADGQAWADRAYALAQSARYDPDAARSLGREAEADANRAIALSPIVAEFWIRRAVALDLQDRWSEAGPDFARALVLSPNAVLPWFHYAYHMSLRATGLDMAEAALTFCLRLDPENPDVQRLRQHLASRRSGS